MTDPLLLTGIALTVTGLAFKASVAPFHQWTPDVYQGAPTPITAFMAVATKAAAFAVFLRLFDQALGLAQLQWAPALAALAAVTIIVGNVGAIAQRSLKRLLAWSSVGQAGYLLAGVVVGSELGLQATAFYLAAYLLMNVTAFAVVIARERVSEHGDDLASLENLGRAQPWLAWPMTIAMLSLAGFPATVGFIGKFYLIDAAVAGDYAWLGVVIVIGSVISLAYYLRVVAVMWMGSLRGGAAGPAAAPREAGHGLVAGGRRAGPARGGASWRCCSPRPRSSSGSGRTRCSTSRATWARRSRTCAEPVRSRPANRRRRRSESFFPPAFGLPRRPAGFRDGAGWPCSGASAAGRRRIDRRALPPAHAAHPPCSPPRALPARPGRAPAWRARPRRKRPVRIGLGLRARQADLRRGAERSLRTGPSRWPTPRRMYASRWWL